MWPDERPLLVTQPPFASNPQREKLTEVMFEEFSASQYFLANQAALALYASGRTEGVVLDSGDGLTRVIPFCAGEMVGGQAGKEMKLAGQALTDYLLRKLKERGVSLHSGSPREIVKPIKESMCYVHLEPRKEDLTSDEGPEEFELPDGEVLRVGKERYACVWPILLTAH